MPDGREPRSRTSTAPTAGEVAAGEVAARVLGARVERSTDAQEMSLVHPDGRRAALEEAVLGDREDLHLAYLRRDSEMQWTAPARWWWQVTIHDVRRLPRVREVFPVVARMCEAHRVPSPCHLPAPLISAVPDLHWLVHTGPAQLLGHADALGLPATVTLCPGSAAADEAMSSVVPALREALASGPAARALRALQRREAVERQLYLTVGASGLAADAFASLVRATGVPPAPPPEDDWLSHLWLAPVLGHVVFLWSREDGWSRHEPYG
ncbi:MAG: hypothetical protein ABWY11_13145 [Umezawaea sp.]